MQAAEPEVPLTGGRSTPGVVRVGGTVRRPRKPDSGRIHRLLIHFERCGFGGAPRFLGVDARGRTVLSFIDGWGPPPNGFELSEKALRAGARLLRQVHDLTPGTWTGCLGSCQAASTCTAPTAATSRNSTTPGTISQGWFIS